MDNPSVNPRVTTMSRRTYERYPLPPSRLTATWLAEGQKVQGEGILGDISAGGFSSWMSDPPPPGRLLHAQLELDDEEGRTSCVIDADLKVCSRRYVSPSPNELFGWLVNLATESMHPADEKLMNHFIERLKKPH